MKLIIEIDEKRYKDVIESQKHHLLDSYAQAIANGTPIPDNATNGNSVIKMFFGGIVRINSRKNVSVEFNKNWWNAPYQKGGKE